MDAAKLDRLSELASMSMSMDLISSNEPKEMSISKGKFLFLTFKMSNKLTLEPKPQFLSARDWTKLITTEDRCFIRDKIRAAYLKKIKPNNFDELLEVCCAVDEELIFSSVPSRLDYFKTGVQFERRVKEKICTINEKNNTNSDLLCSASNDVQETSLAESIQNFKRAKTNH